MVTTWAASLVAQPRDTRPQTDYSESSLPAYYHSSPSDHPASSAEAALPRQALPSESSLPAQATPALPSESLLPPPIAARTTPAQPAPETWEEILAGSRDRTPWLRLVEAEHTAPIRAVEVDASGRNLFTAGEDKVVHHWQLVEAGPGANWQHHATYRWQVQRAELGTILSLTSSGNELFIAGAGADGQQGEIVAVNTATGAWLPALIDTARGHHTPVLRTRMLSEANPRRLVSLDLQHGLGMWTQDAKLGTWSFQSLRSPSVDQQNSWAPMDRVSTDTLAIPSTNAAWSIDFIQVDQVKIVKRLRREAPLASPQALAHALQLAADHLRSVEGKNVSTTELIPRIRDNYGSQVTSLAVAANGQTVAAGDSLGFLYVWNSAEQLILKSLASFDGFRFSELRFSADGRHLAAVAHHLYSPQSIVQLWRLEDQPQPPTLVREVRRPTLVAGIALLPDTSAVLFGVGRQLEVLPLERSASPQALPTRAAVALPHHVVFAQQLPYRWKFDLGTEQVAFDGEEMRWLDSDQVDWQTPARIGAPHGRDSWRLVAQASSPQATAEVWMMRGNQRVAMLDLQSYFKLRPNGRVEQVAWINEPNGQVVGVAIALSGQNDIWVFELPSDNTRLCSLVRVFGGHEGAIASLDCSPDARYLISSSQDCTVRLWPLAGLPRLTPLTETSAAQPTAAVELSTRTRWGCDFSIVDNQLIAQPVGFTGPLYRKGLRGGDHISELSYEQFQADGTLRRTTLVAPQEMLKFLSEPRFDVAVRFIPRRAGTEVPGFQAYPHWREIAAQVIAANREWAVWTPSGFYDASFNGNSLFGWQINRGVQQEPDFYRADRFQAILERPNFMRRLLTAGSIEQAAELAGAPRMGVGQVLENSLALQPRVQILTPQPQQALQQPQLQIRAEVILQAGQQLASSRAFVSGVPAGPVQQLRREAIAGGLERIELAWTARLPADRRLRIQVLCATDDLLVGAAAVDVTQPPGVAQGQAKAWPGKSKMFVLAGGISNYRDSRIPSLELGADNALGVMQTWLTRASSLYDVVPLALTDASLTPHVWRSTTQQLVEQLRQAGPNDLIVLFLSGHGLIDPLTGQYHFVTANARYSDLVRHNYRDCLTFEDLLPWSEIPCRKIVILDTCHSGAVQALDSENLKSAIRTLQSDLVLTLTASEGNQLAAEYRGAQASLFAGAIQAALSAPPDSNRNGLLRWSELVNQVRQRVIASSVSGHVPQFPTAGPKDLLEVIELPVAVGHTGQALRASQKSAEAMSMVAPGSN